ncbi:hypothetical protein B0H10DRAFT_2217957 [Mycena sp. CBHHK59/15]|nr:hypothetical protein B0H10DRAFT_2217957 [Mycena sp. CBHHK59/15]
MRTIWNLCKLVENQLQKANQQLEEFNALRNHYNKGGCQDLGAAMEAGTKAEAGFREGVSSKAESQKIHDELEKIDNSLTKIGKTLQDYKEFWEKVVRNLKSAPSTPSSFPASNARSPELIL